MQSGNKYVASLFLSAALMAPMGAFAMAAPQDDHERHEQEERRERRVYDPYHKDYHNWDDRENVAYRRWHSAPTGTGATSTRSMKSTSTWTTSK